MDQLVNKPSRDISSAEMKRRRKALRDAEADSRLEGQFSSPEGDQIFQAFAHGEIELADILPRIKALHHKP